MSNINMNDMKAVVSSIVAPIQASMDKIANRERRVEGVIMGMFLALLEDGEAPNEAWRKMYAGMVAVTEMIEGRR